MGEDSSFTCSRVILTGVLRNNFFFLNFRRITTLHIGKLKIQYKKCPPIFLKKYFLNTFGQ